MNKTLTISLVAALGLVGGGTYMLMGTDKNFSEYVPDTVSSMLGDYLPESLKAKTISDSTVIIEEYVKEEEEPQIQQEAQKEVVVIDSQGESVTAEQEAEQQVQEQNKDDAVSIAMDEIQESINEIPNPLAVEKTPENSNVSNITQEIDNASMKISKLDIENKELEERFQNILRKNRELAKKLQEIDKQLAH